MTPKSDTAAVKEALLELAGEAGAIGDDIAARGFSAPLAAYLERLCRAIEKIAE